MTTFNPLAYETKWISKSDKKVYDIDEPILSMTKRGEIRVERDLKYAFDSFKLLEPKKSFEMKSTRALCCIHLVFGRMS